MSNLNVSYISPKQIADIIILVEKGELSQSNAKKVTDIIWNENKKIGLVYIPGLSPNDNTMLDLNVVQELNLIEKIKNLKGDK